MKTAAVKNVFNLKNVDVLSNEEMIRVRGKGMSTSVLMVGDAVSAGRPKL